MLTQRTSAVPAQDERRRDPLRDDVGDRPARLDAVAEVAVDDPVRAAAMKRSAGSSGRPVGEERLTPGVVAVEDAEPAAELDDAVADLGSSGSLRRSVEAPAR